MPPQIPPATDVLVLVILAWGVGTAAGGALIRLGGQVQAGHFKVVWLVSAVMLGLGALAYPPAWAAAAACLLAFGSVYARRDAVVGLVAAAGSVAVLVTASLGAETGRVALAGFMLATAALVGSVTSAMLLGHWHLNQPRLGTGPLRALVWGTWGSLGVFVVASVTLLVAGMRAEAGTVVMGATTAAAFGVFSMVLTAMVTHLVKIRSIQSATGILYLEILLVFASAFTGTLAALSPALV